MNSNDLTIEQAARLNAHAGSYLRWLTRLQSRMEKLSFPPTDPLYVAAVKARDAMQALTVMAHYAACKHGVGKPTEAKD